MSFGCQIIHCFIIHVYRKDQETLWTKYKTQYGKHACTKALQTST
jgi:hypothetical protein